MAVENGKNGFAELPEESLREWIAMNELVANIDLFIRRNLRLETFRRENSPPILKKRELELIEKAERSIDFLSQMLEMDPRELIGDRIEEIIEHMKRGATDYIEGEFHVSREDVLPLQFIQMQIAQDDFQLSPATVMEREQFEEEIRKATIGQNNIP